MRIAHPCQPEPRHPLALIRLRLPYAFRCCRLQMLRTCLVLAAMGVIVVTARKVQRSGYWQCAGAMLRGERLQKCSKRIEGDESGEAHCTAQFFDYWKCVDKCVRPFVALAGKLTLELCRTPLLV